jgi:hypothetical protein
MRLAPRLVRMWFAAPGTSAIPVRLLSEGAHSSLLVSDEDGARLSDPETGAPIGAASPIKIRLPPNSWSFGGGFMVPTSTNGLTGTRLVFSVRGGSEPAFEICDLISGQVLARHKGTLPGMLSSSSAQPPWFCQSEQRVLAWRGREVQGYALEMASPPALLWCTRRKSSGPSSCPTKGARFSPSPSMENCAAGTARAGSSAP